ncbi:MAG TPA: TetR/AcrR family transcriptional regulator [Actinomycetes bacterium]|nr:TetR/AcrR family transcriptional regulator [Actinomycetes bacterium]
MRREQILDAAERVLVERGLGAATMADVAEAAAVAKGTVYLYFESKAELLAGLRARYFERFAAMLGDPPDEGRPRAGTAERVERLVAASYDFARANHALHHVLFHEAGFGEVDAFARARAVMADLVEAGRASGELTVADPALATDFLLHGLHGVLVGATHHPRLPRRRLVAGVTGLICQALGVTGPAAPTRPRAPGSGSTGRGPGRERDRRA